MSTGNIHLPTRPNLRWIRRGIVRGIVPRRPRRPWFLPGRSIARLMGALGLLALVASSPQAWATPGMAQAEAVIHGQRFRLDVADTPSLRTRGLGGRTRLGASEGMLFVFAGKARQTFWMKDMRIPIDIIWLDNGRVVYIAHDVPPPLPDTPDDQLPIYRPEEPANLVLEIAAGRSRALGLRVGDSVTLRFKVN